MTNVFIIHGTCGYPKENWFPWLKKELEKVNCKVFVPQFPTPKNQTLEAWFKVFDEYIQYLNEDTVLVGHSLGGAFVLRVLEKYNNKVQAAFIVGAPSGKVPSMLESADKTDLPFVGHEFNWKKIKKNSDKFYVYQSDNDPYIHKDNAKEIAKNVGTKVILVQDAGHFNKAAGYTRFDTLLKKIKSIL